MTGSDGLTSGHCTVLNDEWFNNYYLKSGRGEISPIIIRSERREEYSRTVKKQLEYYLELDIQIMILANIL